MSIENEIVESINEQAKAVERWNARVDDFENQLREIKQQRDGSTVDFIQMNKSIGDQFIKADTFRNFKNSRLARLEIECKEDEILPNASSTTTANSITVSSAVKPHFLDHIAAPVESELNIEKLIPHLPTASDSVQYLYGGALTNNAAVAPQKTKKGESVIADPVLKRCDILTFAHFTKITKQLADDAPALAAYINSKMVYGLQSVIEQQIITGTGSDQLNGLLNSGNFTDKTSEIIAALPAQNATLLDFLLIAVHKMKATGVNPECILLNPNDFLQLSLLKDSDGKYLLGAPTVGAVATLWGIRVVTSNSVASGKYLLANFTLGATIYDRQQIAIEMSDSDTDNFQRNLYTLRVERRLGLAIEHPEAIWGGDFTIDEGSN